MRRLNAERGQRVFGGIGPDAEEVDLAELHPANLGAEGEPALREFWQLHSRLRGLVAFPRDGDGTVEQHRVAAKPLTIAGSDRQPTRPRDHVAEVPVHSVVETAFAQVAVGEQRDARNGDGLGDETLWLRITVGDRQRLLHPTTLRNGWRGPRLLHPTTLRNAWRGPRLLHPTTLRNAWRGPRVLGGSARRRGAQEDEHKIRDDREPPVNAEKLLLHEFLPLQVTGQP